MRVGAGFRFAALGALLFAADRWWTRPGTATVDRAPIVVSAGDVAALRRQALAQNGALPDAAELDAIVRDAVDDEILFREARARQLDATDGVVRRRLLSAMRFLGAAGGDAARFSEAQRLGLDRSDLVVRRRLIERLRADLAAHAAGSEPGDAEMQAYLDAHATELSAPERVRITHVFLDAGRHGANLAGDAQRLLHQLRDAGVGPAAAPALGDALPIPATLAPLSERELAAQLGPQLARRVMTLPLATWSGPLPSAYGMHLVWVHERQAAVPPPLDLVRAEIRERMRQDAGERAVAQALAEWRRRYDVSVAPD